MKKENYPAQFLRFLQIARGSNAEVETQIIIAESLNYINKKNRDEILEKCMEIGKMINALFKSLKIS